METDLIIRIIKDVVLSIAAVTGAYIAIKGLGAWRAQLRGKSEYDLSRRILIALFTYRDAIDGVRHPMMFSAEMPYPNEARSKRMSDKEIHHHGKAKAYHTRLGKVKDARKSLYADLLEAEAIWDNGLHDLFRTLYELEKELVSKVRNHLVVNDPHGDVKHQKKTAEIDGQTRDVMYDNLNDNDDAYRTDFSFGVEAIEVYLKPKLRGK